MDSFCGIYSILNYLSFIGESDRRIRKAFLIAIRSLELSRTTLSKASFGGLGQAAVVRAANAVIEQLTIDATISTLAKFRKSVRTDDPFELAKTLSNNEALVFFFRNPGHWMLCHSGTAKQFIAMDSVEGRELHIRPAFLTGRKIEISKGLVFLNA